MKNFLSPHGDAMSRSLHCRIIIIGPSLRRLSSQRLLKPLLCICSGWSVVIVVILVNLWPGLSTISPALLWQSNSAEQWSLLWRLRPQHQQLYRAPLRRFASLLLISYLLKFSHVSSSIINKSAHRLQVFYVCGECIESKQAGRSPRLGLHDMGSKRHQYCEILSVDYDDQSY